MPRLPDVQAMGARPQIGAPRPLTGALNTPSIAQAEQAVVAPAIVGDLLSNTAERMFRREDAVDRARLFGQFNEEAAAELRRLETEGDLSRPETVQSYSQFLQAKKSELLGAHRGSADSRAALQERFEGIRSTYVGEIAGKSTAAARKLVQDQMQNTLGGLASQAYDAPQSLGDLFATLDDIVDDMGPALSPEEMRAYKIGGSAEIAATAAESMLDHGNIDGAEELLASPDLGEVLPPSVMRRMRSRITVQRVNEERDRTELIRKQRQIEGFLGRDLSGAEKLALVGLEPKPRAATTADKIREFEAVTGRPATDAEIAKMYGAHVGSEGQDNPFGAGMPGRAMTMLLDLAPAYEMGMTTPEQERQLEAAMAALRMPDPITGLRQTEPPPFLANALRARGVDPQAAFEGQATIVGMFGEPGAIEAPAMPQMASGETPDAPGLGVERGDRTIWERSASLAGPVAAATEMGRRIPGISGLIEGSETVQDRTFARNFQRGVVTALQQSPRYAEGEREAIAREVQILGSIVDTDANYRDKLAGLDDALRLRQQTAEQTADDRGQPAEVRRDATAVANLVQQIRQTIGVPPLVRTEAEYQALPAGAAYRDPDGNERVKGSGNAN
jgi:hypothetical protein